MAFSASDWAGPGPTVTTYTAPAPTTYAASDWAGPGPTVTTYKGVWFYDTGTAWVDVTRSVYYDTGTAWVAVDAPA